MGRRAKPVELHILDGNRSRKTKKELRQRQEAESRLRPPSDNVTPPSWLSVAAREEFERIVADLAETKILTNADVYTLAVLCDALVRHREATAILDRDGLTAIGANGQQVQHPAVLVATKYAGIIARYAPRFGLDPSGRASLAIPRSEEKQVDPFEAKFGVGRSG